MRGNQLFGIFSPEKLSRFAGAAQMRGNQLFGIFSPEKLKKVIRPHAPGSREEPRCGGISFSAVFALKSSKR